MIEQNTLKKLQKIELQILKRVVNFCNENNIKYYLIGGTLLGAVRHKGFIPWDDDIDIGMKRDDYEIFIEIWGQIQQHDLIIQNKESVEKVHNSFTKIRKIGTRIIEKETMNSTIFKGVFIDIFPLDNIPKKQSLLMDINYLIFNFLISVSLYKNGYRLYRNRFVKFVSSISSFLSYKFINRVTYNIITKYRYTETEYITSYASGYGYKKQRMHKDVYGEGILLNFEDCEFIAPTNYIKYLEHLFGDYLKLPPIEERGNQHRIIEVNLDIDKDFL